jgi:glutamate/tyrosine decarboxylase-like PLP-dependent enzyme
MAHFTCLAAARNRVLKHSGWNVDADGLFGAPEITVIVGEEAHASLFKVLSLIGLGRDRVLTLPCDDQGRISARNLPDITGPTIVCLQAGNVNSGAFNRAEPLIKWAHAGGAWVHVDGAFGIWTLASTEKAALAKGFTAADSWHLMPTNGSTSRTIPGSLWWQTQARSEKRWRSTAPILCPVNAVMR